MMSVLPFYFCIGALIVILIMRELHHNRIQAGLIDKILEQHGLNAIPHEHPLAEIVSRIERKADEPEIKSPQRMRIPIPGMAAFSHQYNRVMKVKEKETK